MNRAFERTWPLLLMCQANKDHSVRHIPPKVSRCPLALKQRTSCQIHCIVGTLVWRTPLSISGIRGEAHGTSVPFTCRCGRHERVTTAVLARLVCIVDVSTPSRMTSTLPPHTSRAKLHPIFHHESGKAIQRSSQCCLPRLDCTGKMVVLWAVRQRSCTTRLAQ